MVQTSSIGAKSGIPNLFIATNETVWSRQVRLGPNPVTRMDVSRISVFSTEERNGLVLLEPMWRRRRRGDLEQLSIVPDPRLVSLQCSSLRTPIIDPTVKDINEESKTERSTKPSKKKRFKVIQMSKQ
ncbi:hypothetical protein GEV33_015203 [Tenebrio molitor]|uniref:Uncharacterized protein n=1 Tax=Tenebrio molitor TaxID=7067 RepID=A0A8J6H5F3_TENMO|nr:hypothetical protein GEV33_015203 [Tenebrio molitor]